MLDKAALDKAFAGLKKGAQVALQGAAQVAAVVADEAPRLLQASATLREYKLGRPVATCGPGDIWAIYSATSKKTGAVQKSVSVWILDKKRLTEASKSHGKGRLCEAVFEQQKHNCLMMTRLKHPGVVKVIEPLEDTSQQMVLVTEPVFGSVRNVLTHFSSVPGAAQEATSVTLSALEVKAGLVQLAETLSFLHTAGVVHCGLSPGVVMVTASGMWKLAGFGWSVNVNKPGVATGQFTYSDYYDDMLPAMWEEFLKPSLSYVAPEQVLGRSLPHAGVGASVTAAVDVFSLALIAYEAVCRGKPLLQPKNVNEYRDKAAALGTTQFSSPDPSLSPQLQSLLRSMMSTAPASRPTLSVFLACGFFQDDVLLRALRFLDTSTLLQRDHGQKVAFISDLKHFWNQYDDRVLQLLVLPPLIQELRDPLLQPSLIPLVLSMLEHCTPTHFQETLLPALQPALESAQGELLTAFVAGSGTLAGLMTAEQTGRYLVPLYTRALDSDGQPQVQETCLRQLKDSMARLDYQLLKAHIMPRVYTVCMRTTAAVVRVHSLSFMASAVARLDKEESGTMVDTVTQVVAVDRSAGTVVAVAHLAAAISQQHGVEVTATRLLPLLSPLLLAASLSLQQFKEVHSIIQAMLDSIQSKILGAGGLATATATTSTPASQTVFWNTPLPQASATNAKPHTTTSSQAPASFLGNTSWQSHTPAATTTAASAATASSWQTSVTASTSNTSTWQTSATLPTASTSSSATLVSTDPFALPATALTPGTRPASSASANTPGWAGSPLQWSASNGHTPPAERIPGGAAVQGTSHIPAGGVDDMFGGLAVHDSGTSAAHPIGGVGGGASNGSLWASTQSVSVGGTVFGSSGASSHVSPGLSTATLKAQPSAGGGHHTGSSMMSGKPMAGLATATSASSDPFATLNAIALSAPAQPHPKASVTHPAVPVLAPPPKASTTVHTSGQQAGTAQTNIDLLW